MTLVRPLASSFCGRAAVPPPFARVAPERVAGDPARENQETNQFLKADAKGRVFLLHGDNLAVDQILPSGKIVPGRMPHGREAIAAAVKEAALSPDGSSWLLRSGPDELILLSGDDRRELPTPHWWISAVAYTTDGPVVAVLPAWVGGRDATGHTELDKPPFLLRLDGQKWQTLSMQTPPTSAQQPPAGLSSLFEVIKGERDLRLATGRKGALWTAQQNAYLLKRYSRQGAVEESVAVKGGDIQWKERTEEDWKALETPEGLALDRWNDETEVLDRLLLAGIAPGRSYLGMAAGRDGLYIAACGLGEPIWRLDWQRLEDAKWKAVPEAVAQRPRKQ